MRRAARAIVIHDNKLLVLHRNKFGAEYDTLPGGEVEIGEEPAQAALREVIEETTIQVGNPRLVFIEHAGDMYGDQYVFLCDYQSGEPRLHPDAIETRIHAMGKNLYEPRWLALSDMPTAKILSPELKTAILVALQEGWPDQPQEFSSNRTD